MIERGKSGRIFLYIGVALFLFIWLAPTLGLFISSFRSRQMMAESGWWTALLQPGELTFENYREVLIDKGIGRAFLNSLIIAVPATLFPIVCAVLGAFPIAFVKFPGRKLLFIGVIALQVVPLQITLIPVMKMLKDIHLSGTFPGVWVAHTAYALPFSIYLLRNFYVNIPTSLIESARIDGAGDLQILVRLIFPLALPAVASLAIFQFLWTWNDLLIALTYLGGTPDVAPLTVRITSLMGSLESGWHIMTTAAVISMILPLILFFSLQKYFVKGILSGSVKG